MEYQLDGVLSIKEDQFIGDIPDDRESDSDFRIGDMVMATWSDKEIYEAKILEINGYKFYACRLH